MIRKTLTIFSLLGLLLSVGLWVAGIVDRMHVVSLHDAQVWIRPRGIWLTHGSSEADKLDLFSMVSNPVLQGRLPYYGSGRSCWCLYIPFWLLVLTCAAFPGHSMLLVHRRRKRKKLGLCLKCGYDLRASKERCPECGESLE